jgi:hypothetical protein
MAKKKLRRIGPLEAAGPRSWRNWRALADGAIAKTAVELPLFSDAWFTSEALHLGPYKMLNALPRTTYNSRSEWKPAAVLRAEHLLPPEIGDMNITDDAHYHGGTMYDEIAALSALILGVRLVAGPIEREFGYTEDPLGRPRGHSAAIFPALPNQVDAPQIPMLSGDRCLADLSILKSYPNLPPDAAFALVKSARLYQQALWVSDTSPETAWLLLVSAIETAAGFWNAARLTPAEQLELSYSDLAAKLRESSDTTVFDTVAVALYQRVGSTGKFVAFCESFVPEPPEQRPKFGRFDFTSDIYRAALRKIYGYRSRALHGGTPFPHPMCVPPMSGHDGTNVAEERMSALGAGSRGATWTAGDLPMHLHLFAYITRGVLLNWWLSIPCDLAVHEK